MIINKNRVGAIQEKLKCRKIKTKQELNNAGGDKM